MFNELDTSSDVLQILMSPDAPYLQLSTFGYAGSTHVSNSGTDVNTDGVRSL